MDCRERALLIARLERFANTELAAKHSNVDAIFIRDVSNTPARSAEIQKLFAPLPARVVRRMFINTSELDDFTPTPH